MNAIVETYNETAEQFCLRSVAANRSQSRSLLSCHLAPGALILDAGCGSGRDTKAFREAGFQVVPIDGAIEMVKFATGYTGQPVECLVFEEMAYEELFDGIWASVSLVHHDPISLKQVFPRFIRALKPNGYWFLSLKHGVGVEEITSEGVAFYLQNEDSLREFIAQFPELELVHLSVIAGTVGERRDPANWIYAVVKKIGS